MASLSAQQEAEIDEEQRRLMLLEVLLSRFPAGLTKAQLALETKIPMASLSNLLHRQKVALKPNGVRWRWDYGDIDEKWRNQKLPCVQCFSNKCRGHD